MLQYLISIKNKIRMPKLFNYIDMKLKELGQGKIRSSTSYEVKISKTNLRQVDNCIHQLFPPLNLKLVITNN